MNHNRAIASPPPDRLSIGLRCPYCGTGHTAVRDSRGMPDASRIRRRRQCDGCKARFTTVEITLDLFNRLQADGFDYEQLRQKVASALSTIELPR